MLTICQELQAVYGVFIHVSQGGARSSPCAILRTMEDAAKAAELKSLCISQHSCVPVPQWAALWGRVKAAQVPSVAS